MGAATTRFRNGFWLEGAAKKRFRNGFGRRGQPTKRSRNGFWLDGCSQTPFHKRFLAGWWQPNTVSQTVFGWMGAAKTVPETFFRWRGKPTIVSSTFFGRRGVGKNRSTTGCWLEGGGQQPFQKRFFVWLVGSAKNRFRNCFWLEEGILMDAFRKTLIIQGHLCIYPLAYGSDLDLMHLQISTCRLKCAVLHRAFGTGRPSHI